MGTPTIKALGNSKVNFSGNNLSQLARGVRLIFFDFDGVFTDNRVLVFQDGTEAVFCTRADGLGLEAIKRLGILCIVLSTEKNPVVTVRCQKLGIPCVQGCDDKVRTLREEATKLSIDLQNVAYLGNDVNDLECLKIVGFPACVADAHPDVLALSRYVTEAPGGYGAVREFCDLIVQARNQVEV